MRVPKSAKLADTIGTSYVISLILADVKSAKIIRGNLETVPAFVMGASLVYLAPQLEFLKKSIVMTPVLPCDYVLHAQCHQRRREERLAIAHLRALAFALARQPR